MLSEIPPFREKQKEAWKFLQAGKSGLVVLPTGYGKSLLFQKWAQERPDTLTVVLSPLVALIEDLKRRSETFVTGVSGLHGQLSPQKKEKELKRLAEAKISLLFLTPERFQSPSFLKAWSQAREKKSLSLWVVDEAHLISQWGHDFRLQYRRVGELAKQFQPKQILALTATATPEVQKDILEVLGIPNGFIVQKPIYRDNLAINVHLCESEKQKWEQLIFLLNSQNQRPIVIYTTLIRTLKVLQRELERFGYKPLIYHGELPSSVRQRTQKLFMENDDSILLATNAFGLGVDKPNIRSIIHYEIPSSIESYYQEIGRAGRDGLKAQVDLLYDPKDLEIHMSFIDWAHPEPSYVQAVWRKIRLQPHLLQDPSLHELRQEMSYHNKNDHRLDHVIKQWVFDGLLLHRSGQYQFPDDLPIPEEILWDDMILHHKKYQLLKLKKFIEWIRNSNQCRFATLSEYFGFELESACGLCDVCHSNPA